MSIFSEITRINNAKEAIKTAIENKGITVSESIKIDGYAALIDNIETDGGSGESYMCPDFYERRTLGGISYRTLFARYPQSLNISDYNLDSRNVTYMEYMFENFGVGTIDGLKSLDYGKVTSTKGMFRNSMSPSDIDLSGISFPELTNASDMFYSLTNTTSIDLSNVDMPKVTDISNMFYQTSSNKITSINLTGINMPNIKNASAMFQYCVKITTLDLSGINFSKVENVNYLFYECKLLAEVIGEIDCSNVKNGLYASAYTHPFKNCKALEIICLKNIYKDVTAMTNASKWSINLAETVIKDECLIYIIDQLPDLINDKGLTATDKIVLTLPPSNTLTEEQVQVAILKGWTCANIATASATYGLRRRMFYKAVECEEGAYQASDGSRYEIFESNNVVTPDGVAEWDVFSSIEDASEYYGLTYIGEQEDGQ